MLKDMTPEIIQALVDKNYVLFAQKTSMGHKIDYPELNRDPSFKSIGKHDMRFIWAYSCASSPFLWIDDDEERIKACVHYAFPERMRKAKTHEFTNNIPDILRSGITKMEKYNLAARVEEYLVLRQARENVKYIIAQDITKADPDERKAYLSQVKDAQTIMAEQRTRIEGFDLGISEAGDTMHNEAVDVASIYMAMN